MKGTEIRETKYLRSGKSIKKKKKEKKKKKGEEEYNIKSFRETDE